jgi:hypothetical protein
MSGLSFARLFSDFPTKFIFAFMYGHMIDLIVFYTNKTFYWFNANNQWMYKSCEQLDYVSISTV